MTTVPATVRDVDETNSTSRTYAVSLPVIVTVTNDGQVTYSLDTTEIRDAILESETIQHTDQVGDHFATDACVWSDAHRAEIERDNRVTSNHGNGVRVAHPATTVWEA